jgi:O-antigen ligase
VTSLREAFQSALAELPPEPSARWASVLFSLGVAALLISLAASQIFLGAACLAYAAHLFRNRPAIVFPPVKLPLALFCATTLISVWRAGNPAAGGYAVRKLVLFLILLLAVNLVVRARHLVALCWSLFVAAGLAGLVAAWQFVVQFRSVRTLHPREVYSYMTYERVHGFMGHWMNFGGQQMLVFALLLSAVLLGAVRSLAEPRPDAAGRQGVKTVSLAARLWPGWTLVVIVSASIVLSLTRGVWLGSFVAAIYLISRRRARWLLALILAVLIGLLASPGLVRRRLESVRHPSADPSLAVRAEMWHVGLQMIERHPLVGVGPNNINEVYPLYMPAGKAPMVGYHEHLHNDFLQFAAERGLPCLVAWVWFMVALVRHAFRIRRRVASLRWIVDGAIAAWLAMVVEGLFEFNFGTSPVLMVFLFVACLPFIVERIECRREAQPAISEALGVSPPGS